MKKVLGLDLGTTSIGWAFVNEAESISENSSIEKLGVRVNPLTTDEQTNFEKGKTITTTADRTLNRGMRRNLQRYKLRRKNLIEILQENGLLKNDTILSEEGNHSTFRTYSIRAKAPSERIELEDLSRVLLMINKKRGYKSNRKAKGNDEGQLIDGMEVAKVLANEKITPGQFALRLLDSGKRFVPDFYRSDLQAELDQIWDFQKSHHPDFLTDELKEKMQGKGKEATLKLIYALFKIDTAENKGTRDEKRTNPFRWRSSALTTPLDKQELAFVLKDVNGEVNGSSGYLGAISDRSKELYFNKKTVGQYLYEQIKANPHTRLKNQVFYRQDYLDEFNAIWQEQAKYHKELTSVLMEDVRDVVIFYQRKLKSQKGLISFCEFEQKQVEVMVDGKPKMKTRGLRVCPKSSPLFQEFKIWQVLNNLELTEKATKLKRPLELEEKQALFEHLIWVPKMTKAEALKWLFKKPGLLDLNYKDLEGNRTNAALLDVYKTIVAASGHTVDFSKLDPTETVNEVRNVFDALGIDTSIFDFDASLERDPDTENDQLEQQRSFQLWHLLYSYEEDKSETGDQKLIDILEKKFGFERVYARMLAAVTFQEEYGSLSSKAIRKILPHLKEGNTYDVACAYAKYNHSHSLNKEERANRVLKERLSILPKNSLRNPVVEKILNQMVHVVNGVSDAYGKPDEIRIELARELKKSASERADMTTAMEKAKTDHEKYRKLLQDKFGLSYVSRNDIIRYKLYLELKSNGYKTLYSNTYIELDTSDKGLFSKLFDIEHIIPQAKLFDDSFSNKTIELRSENREKGDDTALAFIKRKYGEERAEDYKMRVENLFKAKEKEERISRTKYNKLLMGNDEIPEGFIDRDLRDTQYIAKKAKAMLEEVFRTVNTTTGTITDRLREDWQLVDVMQELNWEKYKALGLTYYEHNREGKPLPRIKDWTKRNDHRHHAMDALTVAFTRHSHVQYLNNLNARSNKEGIFYGIEQKELTRDEKGKLRFNPPIPLNEFRARAKEQLEAVLVSHKAKNKVVTRNKNTHLIKDGTKTKIELTPRGQLHKETVYGRNPWSRIKLSDKTSRKEIDAVMDPKLKSFLEDQIAENKGIAKAFSPAKLSLLKYNGKPLEEVIISEPCYTQRIDVEKHFTNPQKSKSALESNLDSILDPVVRQKLRERYEQHGKDFKAAFSNLTQYPIWMNEEKGIRIKRVITTGISTATPLHFGKDKDGRPTKDIGGNPIPVDFVSTGNNHHLAIYRDKDGNLIDYVVSFYDAVKRINYGLQVIPTDTSDLWTKVMALGVEDEDFLASLPKDGLTLEFSIKQNECFVFPNEKTGFNPNEIDLTNPANYQLIGFNLFRAQKFSKLTYGNSAVREYVFRHHLETNLNNSSVLKDVVYKNIKSLQHFKGALKVRIDHVGRIVQVGEY